MREIRVRLPYRILAGLISLGYLAALFSDISGKMEVIGESWISLAAPFVVLPVFVYVALFGEVPSVLLKILPEDLYKDISSVESWFTKFDARSIGFAIGFLSVVAYMIYVTMSPAGS